MNIGTSKCQYAYFYDNYAEYCVQYVITISNLIFNPYTQTIHQYYSMNAILFLFFSPKLTSFYIPCSRKEYFCDVCL